MKAERRISGMQLNVDANAKTLLIVCPQPPPLGGATVTVQSILDELAKQNSIRAILVNTSPPPEKFSAKVGGFNLEKVQRIASILRQYLQGIKQSDTILVFASNRSSFFTVYVPLLLLLARGHRKPFYLKPFGGSLDVYLANQPKPVRSYLLKILNAADGILAQTRQLQTALIQLGCMKTYYVPGCRSGPQASAARCSDSAELRLIFLSLIHRQKGPMILLDALDLLARENGARVSCDFYGPILEDQEELFRRLESTPGAHYCGMVEPESATGVIATYDALVLPTYFPNEGHPGVIIEAMQAGIPVISTQFRAIPELITHGENGFLVPVQDSQALADAIKRIAADSSLRDRMARASYRRGQEFRPEVVVPRILEIIFH